MTLITVLNNTNRFLLSEECPHELLSQAYTVSGDLYSVLSAIATYGKTLRALSAFQKRLSYDTVLSTSLGVESHAPYAAVLNALKSSCESLDAILRENGFPKVFVGSATRPFYSYSFASLTFATPPRQSVQSSFILPPHQVSLLESQCK